MHGVMALEEIIEWLVQKLLKINNLNAFFSSKQRVLTASSRVGLRTNDQIMERFN